MSYPNLANRYLIKILEHPEEMGGVENLQRVVWPGDDTEIVPAHMLLAAAHNGGLLLGAYDLWEKQAETDAMVGFVFGFPGIYTTPDGPRLKHCSHMMGVHPEHRRQGIGFALKRAQWQMVRRQGLDRITWTYDPLLSRNAHLNIARLGSVCNTYLQNEYGALRDGLNAGLATDRFQVDWWVNSNRVRRRLSKHPRGQLDLAHFLAAGAVILNPTQVGNDGIPQPPADTVEIEFGEAHAVLLVEIPADFQTLKARDRALALAWRMHTRQLFEPLFAAGYLVTDFIYLPGSQPRSFYILSYGESTL